MCFFGVKLDTNEGLSLDNKWACYERGKFNAPIKTIPQNRFERNPSVKDKYKLNTPFYLSFSVKNFMYNKTFLFNNISLRNYIVIVPNLNSYRPNFFVFEKISIGLPVHKS